MSETRTVGLWESPYDLIALNKNKFSFCIAKAVASSNGTPDFNMVFQSKGLAPRTDVTWIAQYALNWAMDVPTANAQVTLGGIWQPCKLGEVYDLDDVGMFQPSTAEPQKGSLKLGKNGYSYPGTGGIHMVVGVKLPGGHFEPIFLDTTGLAPNMSAWYQPKEDVRWWYEKNVQSSSMISGASSDYCQYDLGKKNPITNTHYVSTTYKYAEGKWETSHARPPSVLQTGLPGARNRISGPHHDVDDFSLERIRRDVDEIMYILKMISRDDNVNGSDYVDGNVGSVD